MVSWLEEPCAGWSFYCCGVIALGCGIYGTSVGLWQAPLQALYAAIKFPLLIFLTILGNTILNGMLTQIFGLGLTFRQTSLTILMSFVIMALILGALSPISLFMIYQYPSSFSNAADTTYNFLLLTQIVVIAYAGVTANIRLFQLLKKLSKNSILALRILIVWLAGNMFLGTQLSWILSPFVGLPHIEVRFLQEHPFEKNFFEYAFEHTMDLIHSNLPERNSK